MSGTVPLPGSQPQVLGGPGPELSLLSSHSEGGQAGQGQSQQPHSTAEDVLESYENPPPIVLPSEGFQVDLEAECPDASVHQHLLYIRYFLWSLRGPGSPGSGPAQPAVPEVRPVCVGGGGGGGGTVTQGCLPLTTAVNWRQPPC
jgi:hypothetical protein